MLAFQFNDTRLQRYDGGCGLLHQFGHSMQVLRSKHLLSHLETIYQLAVIRQSCPRGLKHMVVIDLVVVSSGFLIRAVAGAAALSIPLSQWFLLVASFGSLFMVAGKRYSEKLQHEDDGGATRRSLVGYSLSYLRFIWTLAASLALVSYCLWAFELGASDATPLAAISIVPFATALFRYAYSIDTGHAGAPEDTVLGDSQLLGLGLVWLVVFATAVTIR